MTADVLTRKLDSIIFQIKLATNIEDQEKIKSIKHFILEAYKMGYEHGQNDMIKRVTENLFKIHSNI